MSQDNMLDFFKYFQEQSETAYGSSLDPNYTAVPNEPLYRELDDYLKDARETKTQLMPPVTTYLSNQTPVTMIPPIKPQVLSDPQPSPQRLSTPFITRGSVPPGFKPSNCCGNCSYFFTSNENTACSKHDFACSLNYVCSDFKSYEEDVAVFWEASSETFSMKFDLLSAPDEKLELLTDTVNLLREKNLTLDLQTGQYYIFNPQTAEVALAFRHHLTDSSQRESLIKLASKFSPNQAQLAWEEDKTLKVLPSLKGPFPASPVLFKLAASSCSSGDQKETYQLYETLYRQRHGSDTSCYTQMLSQTVPPINSLKEETSPIRTEIIPPVIVELPLEDEVETLPVVAVPDLLEVMQPETLSDLAGASVSAPAYVGSTEVSSGNLMLSNTLYGLAERRVKARAAKLKQTYTDADIQKEFERVQQSRGKI